MPQLNPSPWFAVLVFSWLIFATIVTPKILAHMFPHQPTLHTLRGSKTESWIWPW